MFLKGINVFDALVLQEKLFFPTFSSKSKFIHQMGQTWTLMIVPILKVIVHNKNILIIRMHGFDALDSRKAFISTIFHRINVNLTNGTNSDFGDNLHFFL